MVICVFTAESQQKGWLKINGIPSGIPSTERRKDLEPFDSKSLIHLVRLAGIEPTTPWFVAKYSIQLSYSRNYADYNIGPRPIRLRASAGLATTRPARLAHCANAVMRSPFPFARSPFGR